jgi:hypothetical protein
MKRARSHFGQPAATRPLKTYGYPKKTPMGWALTDGHGNIIGRGKLNECHKIRPGAPGSWIDSKRCSYHFKIAGAAGKAKWYSCRGYGEGIAVSCRRMKKPPRFS